MAGCASFSFGAINYGLCDDPRTAEKRDGILQPVHWSKADTDQTIREAKAVNATYVAECGKP